MARIRLQSGSDDVSVNKSSLEPRSIIQTEPAVLSWESSDNTCTKLGGDLTWMSGSSSINQRVRLLCRDGVIPLKSEGDCYVIDSSKVMHTGTTGGGSMEDFNDETVDRILSRQYFPIEGMVAYSVRNSESGSYPVTYDGPGDATLGFAISASFDSNDLVGGLIQPSSMSASYNIVRVNAGGYESMVPASAYSRAYFDTGHMDRIFGVISDDTFKYKIPYSVEDEERDMGWKDDFKSSTLKDGRFYTPESTIGGMCYAVVSSAGDEKTVNTLLIMSVERALNLSGGPKTELSSGGHFTSSFYQQRDEDDDTANSQKFASAIDALSRNNYVEVISNCVRYLPNGTANEAFPYQVSGCFSVEKYPFVLSSGESQNFVCAFTPPTGTVLSADSSSGCLTFHRGVFEYADGKVADCYFRPNMIVFSGGDINGDSSARVDIVFSGAGVSGVRVCRGVEYYGEDDGGSFMAISAEDGISYFTSAEAKDDKKIKIAISADAVKKFANVYPSGFVYYVEPLPYGCEVTISSNVGDALSYVPGVVGVEATIDDAEAFPNLSILSTEEYSKFGGPHDSSLKYYDYDASGFKDVRTTVAKTFVVRGEDNGACDLDLTSSMSFSAGAFDLCRFEFDNSKVKGVWSIDKMCLSAGGPGDVVILDDYGVDITDRTIIQGDGFFMNSLALAGPGESPSVYPILGRNEMRLRLSGSNPNNIHYRIYTSTPDGRKEGARTLLIERNDFSEPGASDIKDTYVEVTASPFGGDGSKIITDVMAVSTNATSVSAVYIVSAGSQAFEFPVELTSLGDLPMVTNVELTSAISIDGQSTKVKFGWDGAARSQGAYARWSLSAGPDITRAPYFSDFSLGLQKNIACDSFGGPEGGVAWWSFVCPKGTSFDSEDDTIRLQFHNLYRDEISAGAWAPSAHELSAKAYVGWGGYRSEEPVLGGITTFLVHDVVLARGAILSANSDEYSNLNDVENPVVYGDMSSTANLVASAVYGSANEAGSEHIEIRSGCQRVEFADGEILDGTSGIVYAVFSGNATGEEKDKYVVYGVGTAWNIPEVNYIKDSMCLSAYPEFTFDGSTWYRNGSSTSPDGEIIDTGSHGPWNFGTYRISDGRHAESFYYRALLPSQFNDRGKYKETKVELEYTTSSDFPSGAEQTEYIGIQTGKCLSAIQYVDVPPRYVGAENSVHKKATVRFDVKTTDDKYVFENVSPYYYDAEGHPIRRNFVLTTDYYPNRIDGAEQYRFGPSFVPARSYAKESSGGSLTIYYPVDGLVGDTVYDKRYVIDDDGVSHELTGQGLSASMVFPGNLIGVLHGGMSVLPPLSIKGTETVEAYLSAVASGNEASASFDNPGSILWTYHSRSYNTGLICELHPCYEWEEQLGIKRDSYINVMTSARKSYGVAIRADVKAENSWDEQPSIQMDWDSFGVSVSGYTSGYLRSLPEVKFVSPIVVVNRNTVGGYVPWYNESDTSKFDRFTVRGSNTDEITELSNEETIYRMSGFKDAGYYGIEAKGFVTVREQDPASATYTLSGKSYPIVRVKEVFEPYASNDDVYVETYESWSSAVLRTPLSDNISLDYTMTDLAIGPNELMTNDVINRRFEMLQHDLDQVKSISKYYHNPPTKFVGYVGYGSEAYASADYSMDTFVSLRDHFGFWNSGDSSMENRLDWQWCRSSSGEFVCPSAQNLMSATIVSGATSMDIDDNTMNIYATIGSKFKLGGMSSYTQTYETSAHVVKDRDYAEVNATEPRIQSIKVMDNGRVFVLAPDFNRVLCYSKFDSEDSRSPHDLVFMYDFGGLGGGDSNLRFNNPIALALDNGLHENLGQLVYVLDEGNQCVKAFNSYGAFVSMIPYELKKYANEHAVSLAVGVDGTVCVLTNHRILYYTLEGEKKGEYLLARTDPIQLCNNKNSNFLYVVYDDDIVKVSTGGLFVGNFSVSQVWHKIGGWRVHEIPPFYGKIRFMSVTKYDQIYLALDNIILIYADLLREMALAGNTYEQYSWSLDDIKIGKQEYMQDFVINTALHRMYDNIDMFKRSIFARIRVREKNGIKYIKTDNVMASEYAYLQDMPTKAEVFIPSNAPMSARVFNDNIKILYDMIVKLLNWCQA